MALMRILNAIPPIIFIQSSFSTSLCNHTANSCSSWLFEQEPKPRVKMKNNVISTRNFRVSIWHLVAVYLTKDKAGQNRKGKMRRMSFFMTSSNEFGYLYSISDCRHCQLWGKYDSKNFSPASLTIFPLDFIYLVGKGTSNNCQWPWAVLME